MKPRGVTARGRFQAACGFHLNHERNRRRNSESPSGNTTDLYYVAGWQVLVECAAGSTAPSRRQVRLEPRLHKAQQISSLEV